MAAIAFSSLDAARSRTAEIAVYVGCGQHANDVTEYWYQVVGRVQDDGIDYAMVVPDADPEDNNHRLSQLLRENQVTEAEAAQVTTIYDSWATSAAYAVDDLVAYNDRIYSCRQAHTSQADWSPAGTFSLWVVHRMNEAELPWIACEPVEIGWTRTYDGTVYECIQAHTTQADWTPGVVPALWESQAPPTADWAVGVAYVIGDIVTYEGSTYECRQSHTSQAGWSPPVVPALWLLVP